MAVMALVENNGTYLDVIANPSTHDTKEEDQ